MQKPYNPHKMELKHEIARLYRLGQTPVPYKSTNVTEIISMLYLSNKHNIVDPNETNIRDAYIKYGRDGRGFEPSEKRQLRSLKLPPPELRNIELYLYFDKKDNLIKSNREEYFAIFYWKLQDIIKANPGKKVACKFDIGMFTEDNLTNGHTEMILYDPLLNTLEHVDSNNIPKQCARKDRGYFACCEMVSSIMRDVVATLPQSPLYINNEDIYSGYAWGVQSLECSSDNLTEQEKEGYCLMWTTLFGDLALSFPEYSMKQIIEELVKKSKSPSNSAKTENDYLLSIIRGYVVDLSKKMDVIFDDESSQHLGCIRLALEKRDSIFNKSLQK